LWKLEAGWGTTCHMHVSHVCVHCVYAYVIEDVIMKMSLSSLSFKLFLHVFTFVCFDFLILLICIYIHIYIYVCIYTCTHIHICIYIYTYIFFLFLSLSSIYNCCFTNTSVFVISYCHVFCFVMNWFSCYYICDLYSFAFIYIVRERESGLVGAGGALKLDSRSPFRNPSAANTLLPLLGGGTTPTS
jgi:hypothetical protein